MQVEANKLKSQLARVKPFSSLKSEVNSLVGITAKDGNLRLCTRNAFGDASSVSECDGEIEACVNTVNMYQVVSKLDSDMVTLSVTGPNLVIKSGRSKVSLPSHDIKMTPHNSKAVHGCKIKKAHWTDRSLRCSWASSGGETRVAQACRAVGDGSVIHLVSSTAHAWACSSMECSGAATDALIPHESMGSLNSSLRHCDEEHMYLFSEDDCCFVQCGGFSCKLMSTSGQKPKLPSQVRTLIDKTSKWKVSKEDVCAILERIGIFLTECATGVWLEPSDDGLGMSFSGRSDGTLAQDQAVQGTCVDFAEGECEKSNKCYVSHKLLMPMVKSAKEGAFVLSAMTGMVAASSDDYFAAVSTMVEPQSGS